MTIAGLASLGLELVRLGVIAAATWVGTRWLAIRFGRFVALRRSNATFGAIFRLSKTSMVLSAIVAAILAGALALGAEMLTAPSPSCPGGCTAPGDAPAAARLLASVWAVLCSWAKEMVDAVLAVRYLGAALRAIARGLAWSAHLWPLVLALAVVTLRTLRAWLNEQQRMLLLVSDSDPLRGRQ